MTTDFKVDGDKIAKAIALLTSVYNNPSEAEFAKAKALIDGAAETRAFINPVRADTVKKVEATYYESDTKWLDTWFGGGPRRQEVILVGGIPYSGKTHFLVWLAARYPGAKILHCYGEDLEEDVHRYYERAGGLQLLQNVWLVDVQDYAFSVQTVEQVVIQQEKAGIKPDIVVLDHIDIMRSVMPSGGDWQDATNVVREVKTFSKRQNVITIAGSQLHPKTREVRGMQRFYRAKIGKSSNADIILMVDSVEDNEYRMRREKAKGRDLSYDTAEKILRVDWGKMKVEESEYD